MRSAQQRRADRFCDLHGRPGAFVIANPFDVGSAKILAAAGFEALATSSAGFAFGQGHADHAVTRRHMLAHLGAVVSATALPVSADLGKGYADEPAGVAETIALAAETGIVGASIEDATGRSDLPLYPLEIAADRIRAAAEASKALPFPFLLTARAENFLVAHDDIRDVIVRLQAYQEAGADVLYAPGVTRTEDISAIVGSVDRPVNVLAGPHMSRRKLEQIGVKRISLGSSIARSAYGEVIRAATEVRQHGTFSYAKSAVPFEKIDSLFDRR